LGVTSPTPLLAEVRRGKPPKAQAPAIRGVGAHLAAMSAAMASVAQRTAGWAAKTYALAAMLRGAAMLRLVAAEAVGAARLPAREPS